MKMKNRSRDGLGRNSNGFKDELSAIILTINGKEVWQESVYFSEK
jgi:hypothetical protein